VKRGKRGNSSPFLWWKSTPFLHPGPEEGTLIGVRGSKAPEKKFVNTPLEGVPQRGFMPKNYVTQGAPKLEILPNSLY